MKVELIGWYGGDHTHALSAWTSTERDLTPDREERIPAMLQFLADEGHHTPFEKSFLHFLVRTETASHIHLLKHRIGVSVNGESARYKQLREPTAHVPCDWPGDLAGELAEWNREAQERYTDALQRLEPLVGRKRAKESARFFLPYANELTLDVGFNFRSFMHFIALRHEHDAQREIRDIAGAMLTLAWGTESFNDSLNAFGV